MFAKKTRTRQLERFWPLLCIRPLQRRCTGQLIQLDNKANSVMTKGILGRKVGMTKVFDSRNGYRNVGLNKQGKSRPFKCTPAPSATSPVASRVGTVFKKRAERLHHSTLCYGVASTARLARQISQISSGVLSPPLSPQQPA